MNATQLPPTGHVSKLVRRGNKKLSAPHTPSRRATSPSVRAGYGRRSGAFPLHFKQLKSRFYGRSARRRFALGTGNVPSWASRNQTKLKGDLIMNVEMRPITSIRPYENNPRHHSAASVTAVAASIKEFKFRQPIVVDEAGVIIIGHARYWASLQLGLTEVPVHVAQDLTPEQIKALRIADNQTAALSDWDYELLPIELAELRDMDYDLGLLGFDQDQLAQFLDPGLRDGLCDPDDTPAPPDKATTRPRDLWLLGEHRLLCGDSARPQDVDRLLDGAAVHLANTDPPYNVRLEPRSNNAIAAGLSSFAATAHHQKLDLERHVEQAQPTTKKLRAKDRPLENDFVSDEAFEHLLRAWCANLACVLLPGRSFYIYGGYSNCGTFPPALKAAGLYFSQAIIWDKQHPVLNRKDFMGAHEWCFYGWREGAAHQFFGPANVTDLWVVKKVIPQNMLHLTEKPVELSVRALQYSSRPGEHVLDLFAGSGSTLIAAEQTGRKAFLMELDPLYCDVIVQRFEKFTGRPAQRISAAGQHVPA
jgi:DNA modification methylase